MSGWPAELAERGAAINAMLDRLEESFNRPAGCTADLAHELRTPINNLRGEAEVAPGRCRTPAESQAVLASHLEEYERLSRRIEGLLFIARGSGSHPPPLRTLRPSGPHLLAVRRFPLSSTAAGA